MTLVHYADRCVLGDDRMHNVIIFGGTGTLGTELIKQISTDFNYDKITVFSRDELKQQELRKCFPKCTYIIGDIRNRSSVESAITGHDTALNVAAMKHLDVVEDNVQEAIDTNINGSINIAQAALKQGVRRVIFSSTDKAVLPINVYGHTKAIIERYYLNLNEKQDDVRFKVFRWGNILGSRGSVVHAFRETLKSSHPRIMITDVAMSRFWIHIQDAVKFMLANVYNNSVKGVFIPPMKACPVVRLASCLAKIEKIEKYETFVTGIRPGEKIHECLASGHDFCRRSDTGPQLTDEELEEMLLRVFE